MEDLARISLRKAPLYVGVDDAKETATVEGLEQVRVRGREGREESEREGGGKRGTVEHR